MTYGQVELVDDALMRAIDGAINALQQSRPMMEDIGAKLESNARLRADRMVDPLGNAWAPLSPTTVAIYQSEWFIERNPHFAGGIPGQLLKRSGQLLESLSYVPGDDYVDIGTSRQVPGKSQPTWEVGVLHEWGTVKMPRRGLLTADPEQGTIADSDAQDVLDIVQTFIDGALG